jgi:hypothetical protein
MRWGVVLGENQGEGLVSPQLAHTAIITANTQQPVK